MSEIPIDQMLRDARSAALLAWQVILPYFRGKFDIFEKHNDGPATQADIDADHAIVEYLVSRYPFSQYGYLTEETHKGDERMAHRRCWMIDPIDGTREFIDGRDDFAIHIGMCESPEPGAPAEPLLGVVYMPRAGLLYQAGRGLGAWEEDMATGEKRPMEVTHQNEVARATLIVTRQSHGRRLKAAIEKLQVRELIQRGSFGVKVMDVVARRSDLYLNTAQRHCKEWDALAPHAILNEAGGKMSDLTGEPIVYNRPDVYLRHGCVASNGMLHDEVISHLAEVRELWETHS